MGKSLKITIFVFSSATLALRFILAPFHTEAADFQSPRVVALGGASHAGPLLNDSIYMNPSYTSFMPTYSLGFNFLKFSGSGEDSPYYGRNYSATIQDGRSDLFQAGMGYTVKESGAFVHVGASKAAIRELGFGLGFKFFLPNQEGQPLIKEATFSTTFAPMPWLQAALIVDNIFGSDSAEAIGLYREIVLGTKFNALNIVLLYFDPHLTTDRLSDERYGYELGVEFPVMRDFFLRVGAFRNANVAFQQAQGRGYGLGFGWVAPRLSLDYGLQRVIEWKSAQLPSATAHVFGATAYF